MAQHATKYDLILLLSPSAPEEQRAKILADVERAITSGGGVIENKAEWGRRPLSFQIAHQAEADYHLLQFTAPGSLPESLSHDLRITDGVLRHRIIKVLPGTPPPPSGPPPVVAVSHGGPQPAPVGIPAEPDDEE